MKYLVGCSLLLIVLFSGCTQKEEEKESKKIVQVESKIIKDETIEVVAQELKDKTSKVIDTAAAMAKELSAESEVIAEDIKVESKKVIKQIARETKIVADEAVETINKVKESFDVHIKQIETQEGEPKFLTNESDAPAEITETKEDDTLSTEENTQAKDLYLKCAGCHGQKAERSALNQSEIIQSWDAQKIVEVLKGYQAGTYGAIMKGLMQGQVSHLSDEEIQLLADYITTLK